ncbi:PIG-L family deacetylase [Pseudotenacibaculum sp. MALMAid0570]|uniref:PIG-L deacetylase family protein n=1 Tax=Pseudotenacibaculum sp. MALMAid0570 TaxID=3143938 RepID=UPI0032DFAB04
MEIKNKVILAIAPHLDDIELGLGATIHKLSENNTIHYLGLSMPPLVEKEVFMKEFWESCKHLKLSKDRMVLKDYNPRDLFKDRMDILQLFYDTNKSVKPDIVFVPNSKDIHQSHQVAYQEARRAFKYSTILGYELPWNSMTFDMDVFIEISEDNIKAKQASINSFETQKHRMFFSNDIITDLAKLRGKQIGKDFAECFELTRIII